MTLSFSVDDIRLVRSEAERFVKERNTGNVGEYYYSVTGAITLYSSCYALMTLHYLDCLPSDAKLRAEWADYLNTWQDPETGYFIGPEFRSGFNKGSKHDPVHLKLHLTTTVLPCLNLIGHQPRYKLSFGEDFLSPNELSNWLTQRNWNDAWLEGNNLLFVLQVLIYLRDFEHITEAHSRVDEFFSWLKREIDPQTGLWGTNGYCSSFIAMCGGYHQLLAYYYEGRQVYYPERLVDTTLALQHSDGGFHPIGGGGACEDVDAVDILVNLYKLNNYRRSEIRHALRKALKSILRMQTEDGGFVYRRNESFSHMGIDSTMTPPNKSNMFATWFRIHTLALISEILTDSPLRSFSWKFNKTLSMGWHLPWDKDTHRVLLIDLAEELRHVGPKQYILARTSNNYVKAVNWYSAKIRHIARRPFR